MACHQRLGTAQTEERRPAWHDIITFGQHTRSKDVGHGMPSLPLDCKHSQTKSGVAFHHRLWAAQMVEQRLAWHAIIALGRQTRSNDVRRDMPSPPLDSTHGRATSVWHAIIAIGHDKQSNDVGHDMPSSPLSSTHGRTTSGVACHQRLWTS